MRRPLQIEVENRISHRVEIRSLDQPFAVIGRDPNCDIVLEDKQVSRRHAYLQVIAGRLFWVDLDSQLGTFVEGQTWKSGWLGDDRIIAIGPNDIRQLAEVRPPTNEIATGPPQGSPLIWRTYGDEQLAEATVEFLNGPSESKTWPIRRVLSLIGTARRCKFRLADRSIEPFHCTLIRTPQGLFVVDLLGGEGLKVNDAPARSALVRDGDMLQVGRYQIRVHCRAPEAPSPKYDPSQSDRGAASDATQLGLPVPSLPSVTPAMNARVEILPGEINANYAIPAAVRQELTETLLVPLVSQFGLMQQQMFDQFQQTMSMMVQMFGKMHESQMEVIRQEFDRLNDLTKEMNDLKAELAEMTRKQAEKPPPTPVAAMLAEMARKQAEASTATSNSSTTARPRPTIPTAKVTPPAPKVMSAEPLGSESLPAGENLSQDPAAAETVNTRPQPAVSSEASAQGGPGDRDVIFWLHQRINNIQSEREGRWQKILKLIPGAS